MKLEPGYALDVAIDQKLFGRKFPSDALVKKAINSQLRRLRAERNMAAHWIIVDWKNGSDGVYVHRKDGKTIYKFEVLRYSTQVDDAMRLVAWMRKDGFSLKIHQFSGDSEEALVSFVCGQGPCERHRWHKRATHHGAYDVDGATLPMAIVKAALIAKKVLEES